jgi:4-hydroxy-tetrahydrodipicolinate reductase
MGVIVATDLETCLAEAKPQAALLTTVSTMAGITPQIEAIVAHGLPVVSTCEELLYPFEEAPELADRIDRAARAAGVAVLGTGVNPGFLMDSLPSFLTAVCQRVDSVKITRVQDATFRRVPFQKKIGAGLSQEEFDREKTRGSLRHVGLTESMLLIAAALGWKLTRTEDNISPVIVDREIRTDALTVPAGHAAGVQQIGRGWVGDEEKLTLLFRAAVGEKDPHDTVEIKGNPDVNSTIAGGVNGDVATCAITINAVRQIVKAASGLRTMIDVPLVSCRD